MQPRRNFVDDVKGSRTDGDVDAKFRLSNAETTTVCQPERDLAIPDNRLEIDAHVSCDALDAALERK